MNRPWKWFLMVIYSVAVMLAGLFWDALIHSQGHVHVDEPLLTLSNPGHVLFGLGLILTALTALAGFTASWLSEHPAGNLQRVTVPALAWIVIGLAGAITLVALSQTG